ncbi:DNA polymerase III subunit gamma/tau [Campylobacter sp. 19-13652]|uniref:DNA polymerase III subunit gamma/tau n=1 Tax=Campylobacter sp. 19-13652 TaxID=2840180 RepID=UPI001C749C20|nr:DNA polymerase III subunit gamma/tau [Campylobacter sp. 19-13652]BCX79327.1 DNA polymerase III subunit gamma/tau [Campylobacter sp. 19-13652]
MEALALKYRPKNFEALIGQEAVSKSLMHALKEGRISHAYLFSGLRGSGKTSSARIFSKALVCEHGPTPMPCETCPHCIMANEGRHIDIIEMDAASHRKIDDIRELIEQTRYTPSAARFKIFIIDEVHMLTKEAFNALLKTLEEPPSYVKFILATTDPLKLPATVLSRTQHFRFKQISRYAIVKHLEFILNKEGVAYELGALEILARSGSGSLRDTLTLLDQAIIYAGNERISQQGVAQMLGLLDPEKIEQILNTISIKDKNSVKTLIAELDGIDAEMMIDEMIANLKEKFLANDPKFSLLVYERFFRILSKSKSMLGVSTDNGFILSLMMFMMIEAMSLKEIDEAIIAQSESLSVPLISQQTSQQEMQKPQNQTPASQSPAPAPARQPNAYDMLLERLYDRDYSLGECFEASIKFISFDGKIMHLTSHATGAQQAKLRESSKIILSLLRSLFGAEASIAIKPATSQSKPPSSQITSSPKPQDSQNKAEPKQSIEPVLEPMGQATNQNSYEQIKEQVNLTQVSKPQAKDANQEQQATSIPQTKYDPDPEIEQIPQHQASNSGANEYELNEFDGLDELDADLARLSNDSADTAKIEPKTSQNEKKTEFNLSAMLKPKSEEEAKARKEMLVLDELARLFGEPHALPNEP